MKKSRLSRVQLKCLFIGIHILAVIYAAVFLHPYYGSNDEFSLAAIASGAYGENTSYFVYLHSGFAWLLKRFYLLAPSLNWYTGVMYGLIFASLTGVGLIWIHRAERTGFVMSVMLALCGLWPLYVELQYTKTAAVVTAAGYVFLFCRGEALEGKEQESVRRRGLLAVLGVLLLLLGSWIRFQAFGMVSLIAFGLWLARAACAWKDRDWKEFLLWDCAPCAAAFVLVFGSIAAENLLVYRPGTPEAHYREYDRARQRLLDYGVPKWEEYQAEYEALGLTRTDCINLQNWLIADYDRYTAETFRSIAAFRKARPFQWEYLLDYLVILVKKPLFLLSALFAFLWFFSCRKKKKVPIREWLNVACPFAALLGVYLYFIGIYRVLPIVVTACLLSVLIFVWSGAETEIAGRLEPLLFEKRFFLASLSGAVLVCAVCARMLVVPALRPSPQASGASREFRELYDTISADKKLYYAFDPFTNNGMELGYSIFEKLPDDYLTNIFTLGGWETESPQVVANLENYGQRSLLTSLYRSDRAVLISNTMLEHIMLHLQDTYEGIFITYSKVNQIGNFDLFALNYKMSGLKETDEYSASLNQTYTAENGRYDVFEATVDMNPQELEGKSVFLWTESVESGKKRMYQGVFLQQDANGLYSMLYDIRLPKTNQVRFMVPKMSYPLDDRYEVRIVIRDQDKGRKIQTKNNLYQEDVGA